MEENRRIGKYRINGLRCQSCVLLIEDELGRTAELSGAKVDLQSGTLSVTAPSSLDDAAVCELIKEKIGPHGYDIGDVTAEPARRPREFLTAVPAAALFVLAFIGLQRSGLVDLTVASGTASYWKPVMIGLVASVSSCLAVVGGLVLSLAANQAKGGRRALAQASFHVGRLIGFFLLGGLVGWLGQSLRPTPMANLMLNVIVGLVMLGLGLSLMDLNRWTDRLQLRLPKRLGRGAIGGRNSGSLIASWLVGAGTFFLPCGFTQSMQLQALSTGSFWSGALTMAAFALGTLPVLALLSFGSFSVARLSWRGVFFKTAGIVIVLLSLFNLYNLTVVAGWLPPLFL